MKNVSLNSSRSWGIAVICSFLNFLYLGIARQSGLLYLATLSRYGGNRSQASLPFVLCYTIRNVSGPLVGYLGRKVGLQPVILIGGLLASIGMGACFFAEDILTVTVLWGGVFGLGFGMGSVLIPVVLSQYFDKYFSNANGISLGGECIAGFVLPVVIKLLLNTYGTSGMFLILSGLMLHSVPAAMLLKMPAAKTTGVVVPTFHLINRGTYNRAPSSNTSGVRDKSFHSKDLAKSMKTNLTFDTKQPNLTTESSRESKSINNENTDFVTTKEKYNYFSPTSLECADWKVVNSQQQHLPNGVFGLEKPINNMYLSSLNQDKELIRLNVNKSDSSMDSQKGQTSAFDSLRVFLDPAFILMLLSQSAIIFVSTMFLTVIVDFARDTGVSTDEETYILMCLATADMVGRFGLGWVTDSGYMSNVTFYLFCYFGLGAMISTLVFIKGFILIMSAAFFIGLFIGGILIVSPGVVSDYIEKDQLTMALASRFILYAPMSVTQSPLIGFFRERLGSYNWLLHLLSLVCLLSSILALLIPVAAKMRKKRKTNSAPQNTENFR